MDRDTKHNKAMAKQKAAVDDAISKADIEQGVSVLLTEERFLQMLVRVNHKSLLVLLPHHGRDMLI